LLLLQLLLLQQLLLLRLMLLLLLLLTQRQVLVDVGVPVDLERHHLLIARIRQWLGICKTHDKAINVLSSTLHRIHLQLCTFTCCHVSYINHLRTWVMSEVGTAAGSAFMQTKLLAGVYSGVNSPAQLHDRNASCCFPYSQFSEATINTALLSVQDNTTCVASIACIAY
jgi:hypothetical protein